MNKGSKYLLLSCIVAFVAASAIAFILVEEKNAQFWISYVMGTLALGAVFAGGFFTSKDTDTPSSYSFTAISGAYLVAVVLAIIIGHALSFSVGLYIAVHIALLAIFVIVGIATHGGDSYIKNQGAETRRQVIKAKMDTERVVALVSAISDLPADVQTDAKTALSEVEDKLRYSDPMQSEETMQQALEVETALDTLEFAFDELSAGRGSIAELQQAAKIAIRKIDAYNRAKMISK